MLDFFDYQMPDNQARDLKYQINQYLSEILIVTLVSDGEGNRLRGLLLANARYGSGQVHAISSRRK